MKKLVSLIAIATVALSSVAGTFAQKQTPDQRTERGPGRKGPGKETSGDITFGPITASADDSGVLIEWQMVREKGNLGFRIFRTDAGGRVQVSSELVYGSSAKAGRFPLYGEQYSFIDPNGGIGSTYEIESIDLDGRSLVSSPFSASFTKSKESSKVPLSGVRGRRPTTKDPKPSSNGGALFSQEVTPPPDVVAAIGTPSLVSDPIKHKDVVDHPGVRIGVKQEGIYRVTSANLQAAGFDTTSDPSNWQLYLNGVEQAITVGPGASYVEFYGNGIDTIESDIQGYFLIVGDGPGKRIQNLLVRPSTNTASLKSYNQQFTFKDRLLYLNSIFNGPAENFFGRGIFDTGTTPINITLTGIDYTEPDATLDLKYQGNTFGAHMVEVTLNGQVVGTQGDGVFGQVQFGGVLNIPTSLLRDASLGQGTNVLTLKAVGPPVDVSLFDTVSIGFSRKHAAFQNSLRAYTVSSRLTNLTGFSSANARVFDISRPDDPKLLSNIAFQLQGSTYGATIPASRAMSIIAVENSAILTPVSITPNDGILLGDPSHNAELIIIAYKDFMAEAQNWANYRAGQGINVEVVNVDEIFNEFGYGVLSSDSIEAFLNYAYNNWGTPSTRPKYVLLIGDASYDSRSYLSFGFFNYVPTRIVSTTFTETGSDESLADFDDDGLAEMAVGRIPARTPAQVANALSKTVNWEGPGHLGTDPLARGALFSSQVNSNEDFVGMSNQLKAELPIGTPTTMVTGAQVFPNPDTAPLLAAMNTGNYLVNFSGHGSTGSWASTYFDNASVSLLTNHNNESLFTMLTCLNGYFLNPNVGQSSLAENLLNWNNGGAVAVWSSTGLTITDDQMPMGLKFYELAGQENPRRLGDLIKEAKAEVQFGPDVRLSWALLGDPMLLMVEPSP